MCKHFLHALTQTNNSNHQISAAQRTATLHSLSHLNNEQGNNHNFFSLFFLNYGVPRSSSTSTSAGAKGLLTP